MADNPFAKYASQPGPAPIVIGRPDPNRARDQANEDERVRIAREAEARQQAADARAAEKAAREAREWAATHNDDGTPKPDAPASNPDRKSQIKTLLDSIQRLRGMAEKPLAVGGYSKNATEWPVVGGWLGQNRKNVEGALKQVEGDLIQQQIAVLSAMNGGKGVATMANSEGEAARMAASVANLSPDQSPEEFLIGLQRAEDYYLRQAARLEGRDAIDDSILRSYLPDDNPRKPAPIVPASKTAGAGATEASKPIPTEMQAAHEKYLRDNWGKLSPDGYAAFRAQLDRQYGFEPDLEAYRKVVPTLNERAAQGGDASGLSIPAVNYDLTDREQVRNDVMNSALGRGAAAYANSAGFGIPGLMTGDKMDLMRDQSNGEMFAGDVLGGITGAGLVKGGLGLAAKALPRGASWLANPVTAEMVYGGAYGGAENDDNRLLGAGAGVASALLGDVAGQQIAKRAPAIVGKFRPSDTLNRGERAVYDAVPKIPDGQVDPVAAALAQADSLGVPMTLADASPELGSLAGSAVRHSPTVAGEARRVMAQRNAGQLDRLGDAVARDLGPVTNIPQRSEDLLAQAKAAAGPLYDAAYAAPGVEDLNLSDLMSRPSMAAALKRARRIALEEGRNPDELGFVMNDAGDVMLNDAGRYVDARGPRPTGGSGVVSGAGKKAPPDLVTFVRQSGGLRDQGGELGFMGIDNAGRRGTPMAGQDTKFGRLIDNERGKTIDDMAQDAWEGGYFGPPETTPRPTTNEFLSALEDTYTGSDRRFSIYDDAAVQEYKAAEENLNAWRNAEGQLRDQAVPVGMEDLQAPPLDAYGSMQAVSPTWQTLDYVKRGLDDVLEGYRDKTTGRLALDTEGRAVNDTLHTFLSRVDAANPDYAAARAAYAGPVQERSFLQRGQDALRTRPDEIAVELAKLTPEQKAQMRLGYQSEVMGKAGDLRSNSNPWAQLNTPNTEGRLNALYGPEGNVDQLLSQRDLELQLAGSANRLIGNSATAEREVADAFFKQQPGIGGDVAQAAAETALLGGPWLTAGKKIGDSLFRGRREAKALASNRALADEIGPLLLNDVPTEAAMNWADIGTRAQEFDALLEAVINQARGRGRIAGAGIGATTGADFQR